MASITATMERPVARRISTAALKAPRLVMSWEDWLTFVAAVITFLAVAVSLEQANWVDGMPPFVPTTLAGLLIGMVSARIRYYAAAIHPVALTLGAIVVILAAQSFADGVTFSERLSDFRIRMHEWYNVVRAGDISNDNLPFVTLIHALIFLATYFAAWCLFRWHNAWLAIVPSGVILLTNISFLEGQPSGAFVVFLFGAIVLIGRLHLQRSQLQWRKEGVEYPDFISVSAIQLTVVSTIGLIMAAWFLPLGNQAKAVESVFDTIAKPVSGQSDTLVRLFHNIDSRKGAQLHSFGDTLPIQGDVKLGTKQLFEVKSPESGLIRATSYDNYTGAGWKVTGRDTTRIDASENPAGDDAVEYLSRVISVLRVTVLDGESTLLTPGTPIGANLDTTIEHPDGFQGDIEEMRSRRGLNKDDTYNALGSQSLASVQQLLLAGTDHPDWVKQKYLQLPKNMPERVREEALRVTAARGAATDYEKAKAIEEYIRTFPYDLAVPSPPPGRDAADFLIFDLKRGYFDYQSTAMCVMLRSINVPCRIAVGYALDAADGDETSYLIRKDNAYTWVEVFFPTYGWINFNPTADRPQGGAGPGTIDATTGGENPDPSVFEDTDPFANLEGVDINPDSAAGALLEEPVVNEPFPWPLVIGIAAVLAIFTIIGVCLRMAWNWGMGDLEGRAQLWAKIQRLASWAKLGSRPAETPREWSRRMGRSIDREPAAIQLSNAYEEAKYGRPDLVRIDDADAEASYKDLRAALIAKLSRRKPRKS